MGEETSPTGDGKIRAMTPVGAVRSETRVSNRTASACPDSRDPDAVPSIPINRNLSGLETVPTKHRERKCLFIFRIHYKTELLLFFSRGGVA